MIKKLFLLLITLAFAIWLGTRVAADPGYVLFSYGNTTMEMPLWFFVAVIVLLIIIFHFCLRAFHGLRMSRHTWRRWRAHKHSERTIALLADGIDAYMESDLAAAEHAFVHAAKLNDKASSGYLLLADMALAHGDLVKTQVYTDKAVSLLPKGSAAAVLCHARVMAMGSSDEAIALVEAERQSQPKHKGLLQFLLNQFRARHQWQSYISLLPLARRLGLMNKSAMAEEQLAAYRHLMQQHMANADWHALQALWLEMPRAYHHDVELLVAYGRALSATGKSEIAEKYLKREIKKRYDSRLVTCYGELDGLDKDHQLQLAEKWVKQHPDDPDLLMVLGKLCIAQHLWGKARDYLEQAMVYRNDSEVCEALGFVLEQFKETHAAMDIYRQGLSTS